MENQRFFELITKSQTEQLSRNERDELDKLISLNPKLEGEAEFVANFWSGNKFSMEANGDHLFGKINREINSNSIIPLYSDQSTKTKGFFTTSRIAASILFFLVVGIMAVFIIHQISSNDDIDQDKFQVKKIEKYLPSGQKLRVFLPDGSIVWLNSESKLTYPEEFSNNVRIVELEGEAFFEVSKNPEKPFTVKSGEISTTALGTSFNVRSYGIENNIQVTLATGKVLVEVEQQTDQKFFLDPGYTVDYLKESGIAHKRHGDVEKIIGWKDGVLQFENDNFETVVNKLSRWYGVEFVLEEPFAGEDWKYSGWFKNDYLNNVLESISFAQDFNYEIKNKKVIITFKN